MVKPAMPEKFLVGGDEGQGPFCGRKMGAGKAHKVLNAPLSFSTEACEDVRLPSLLCGCRARQPVPSDTSTVFVLGRVSHVISHLRLQGALGLQVFDSRRGHAHAVSFPALGLKRLPCPRSSALGWVKGPDELRWLGGGGDVISE